MKCDQMKWNEIEREKKTKAMQKRKSLSMMSGLVLIVSQTIMLCPGHIPVPRLHISA